MPYSHLTNAVISDSDAEMLEKPVTVRDGDDLINFDKPSDETDSNETDGTEVDEEEEESEEEVEEQEEDEESDDETDSEETDGADDSEPKLPEYQKADPKTLQDAAALMAEAEAGQQDLAAKAIENGLAPEAFEAAKAEYEKDGKFSEKSYELLAAAGYSKSFIDSYMAGQSAVAERFVASIYEHVGGKENFDKVAGHLAEHKPEVAEAFDAAVARNDVATIRALLDVAVADFTGAPASKAPKRNITANAKPAKPANSKVNKVEGFTSKSDMVKAMSDVRYQKDPAFRREVELKVLHAKF